MKLISTTVIFLLCLLFQASHAFTKGNNNARDSMIVAKSNTKVEIDKKYRVVTVLLKLDPGQKLDISSRYSLCFDQTQLKEAPEGVYEIYLSAEKLDRDKLLSKDPFFVDVLNTYGLDKEKKKNV